MVGGLPGRVVLFPFPYLASKARELDAGTATGTAAVWTKRKAKRSFFRLFTNGFRLHVADRRAADAELPGDLAPGEFAFP